MEDKYLLEMTNICKSFPGVKALDNASLRVSHGTVHALMGENGAGKSTLMKSLFGIYKIDKGDVLVEGMPVSYSSPKDAMEHGVAMVHQELNQVSTRSVMENIWLGRFTKKAKIFISNKDMYNATKELFDELEIDISPKAIVNTLSVSKRQMIEIAKAVSYNAKILVLDEPTSSLSTPEVKHLFKMINKLRDRGCGIIYISHKMDEILEISDAVTILRDGQFVSCDSAKDLTTDLIIQKMVGRELENRYPEKKSVIGDVLLECENMTGLYQPNIKDISFKLHKGEVLGIAGLVGSRRTELVESLFGLVTLRSGTIKLEGNKIVNKSCGESIKNGFALVTEERRATGILGKLNIIDNTCVANLKNYRRKIKIILNKSKMRKDAEWGVEALRTKTPNVDAKIMNLSGGNQQKVILARWILTNPKVMMLDEPTRGIDVGAKYEIYQLIDKMASEGKGVMMVSSEMEELMGICDRMLVLSNGRLAGELTREEWTQEKIMTLAAMYV